MNVNGKVLVITDGSSSLGLGLAKYYAKQNAKLVLLARDVDKLNGAQQETLAQSPKTEVAVYSVDAAGTLNVDQVIKQVVKGLNKKLFIIVASNTDKVMVLAKRWVPSIVQMFSNIMIKRVYVVPGSNL